MSGLRDWQRRFRGTLLAEESEAPFPGLGIAGEAGGRLGIYRGTVLGALAGALALSFPAVEKLVGEAFFARAAEVFARAHPPRAADLYGYGAGFPQFLRDYEPARTLSYLADVARFEWAVSCALHVLDVPALGAGDLAAYQGDAGRLRFTPHPAAHALAFHHPARAIALASLGDDAEALGALALDAGEWLLVHRAGHGLALGVAIWDLAPDEHEFAAALFAGTSLDEAAVLAPEIDHGAILGGLIARGAFAAPLAGSTT